MRDGFITLLINYGGKFVQFGDDLSYEGGTCKEYYQQDIDLLSYFELKWHAKQIGLLNVKYYYHIPELSLLEGLRKVENDKDAMDMIACVSKSGRLVLYFEQCVDELSDIENQETKDNTLYFQPPLETQESRNDIQTEIPHPNDPFPNPSDNETPLHNEDTKADDEGNEEVAEDVVEELEDLDTSDEEWVNAKANANKHTQQQVIEKEKERIEWAASMCFGPADELGTDIDVEEGFQSNYENSEDELDSLCSDDDDVPRMLRKKTKLKNVDENTNFKTLKWRLGMTFATPEKFKDCITRFAVAQGYDLKINVSDSTRKRVGAICKKGCKFKVYASWDKRHETYVVKTLIDHHVCTRNMLKNRQLTSSWLAKFYLITFKERPHWPAKEIIENVKKDFGVCIAKWVAYDTKYAAHNLLHGSMLDHYSKAGRYLRELIRSNEGKFILYTNPTIQRPIPVFQRFFIFFEGIKQGLVTGCRRVMCIDACFLKTFLGGCLLAAVGMDGNNQMFPIAWAVAEGENNDSWEWFLTNVKAYLGDINPSGWTFLSDEHKAIIHAISSVFPNSEHRHCARHIYANWKKVHKGEELKMLFWNAAKAYNITDFKEALEALTYVSRKGAEDFNNQNPRLFCRAFMRTDSKCDVVVNNMAETFNAYIVPARSKHLIYMLEDIRMALMERIVVKRNGMLSVEDEVCPRIRSKLDIEIKEARNCVPIPSSDNVFQVGHGLDSLTVNLSSASCTCRRWDLSGIPCCHAIACLGWLKKTSYDPYVNSYFKKEAYLRTYATAINPCLGERHWPECNFQIEPPHFKVAPGRPRKSRRRDPHEDIKRPGKLTRHGRLMGCSTCKEIGHNKRGCPKKQTAAPTDPQRGRKVPCRPRKRPRVDATKVVADGGTCVVESDSRKGKWRGRGRVGRGMGQTFEEAGVGAGSGHIEISETEIRRRGNDSRRAGHGGANGRGGGRAGAGRGLLWWIDGSGSQDTPTTSAP